VATVLTLETPELGDRSYLIHDGTVAVVIDPQRDLDRILAAATAAAVQIVLVAETHLHNDYVTGGLELARRSRARYVIGGGREASFDCRPATDGERLDAGSLRLLVVATPGHTEGHVAYVVEQDGRPVAVCTGGSMLFGTVGRTDLVSAELTPTLTRSQHASVRRLAATLGEEVTVHPTHGFGSFCSSSAPSGVGASTIGAERRGNLALRVDDPQVFAAEILAGLADYPAYYRHMGLLNRAGPAPLDLSPPAPVSPPELRGRIESGQWVVDLRPRRAFARAHLAGTIGAELSTLFTTYLGWVLPWGMPVTLLAETEGEGREAQRSLARIGIDRPAGLAVAAPQDLGGVVRSYPVTDFKRVARRLGEGLALTLLDVRRDDEWARGHVVGAWHLPLPDLDRRLDRLPAGTLWVHCGQGYRASLAASLLDRSGREVVLVDDDWENAASAGLSIESGA